MENTNIESTKTPLESTTLKNAVKAPQTGKRQNKGKGKGNSKQTPVSIDSIAKSPKLTAEYIDKLLKTLADDKTGKGDKKVIRRYLRQLGHKGGLRSTKYATTKSIADFVK